MKTRISLFVTGILMFLLACNGPVANSQSFVRAVERAKHAVVMIRTYDAFGKLNTFFGYSGGSGIIIDKDKGYILTNYHVIDHEDADFILATFPNDLNGQRSFPVSLVGYDHLSDLAVLKIDVEKALPLSEIEWSDSDNVQIGEPAIAIGYPHLFDLQGSQQELVAWETTDTGEFLYEFYKPAEIVQPTVSVGIVSATDKIMLGKISGEDRSLPFLIQTDAAINGGNSGGALVNEKGQLIGINTWSRTEGAGSIGINFAISANPAEYIKNQLINFGYVQPIYLGLKTESITYELGKKLQRSHGTIVSSVDVDSPAALSGIKKGDVITSIARLPIKNDLHFKAIERLLPINQEIVFTLIRDGKHQEIMLIPIDLGTVTTSWGVVAQPNRETLENYTRRGAIVTNVIPDSVLGREGLEPGDLIFQINHRKIHSLEDYKNFGGMLPRGRTVPIRYYIERRIGQNSWYRIIDFNTTY